MTCKQLFSNYSANFKKQDQEPKFMQQHRASNGDDDDQDS